MNMIPVVVRRCVCSTCDLCALICCRLFIVIPFLSSLCVSRAPTHPNIAADTDTAALLSDSATQGSAFGQTRELLRAVDLQGLRLHLETVRDVSLAWH